LTELEKHSAALWVDPLLKDLLRRCLQPDARARADTAELLQHPYFAPLLLGPVGAFTLPVSSVAGSATGSIGGLAAPSAAPGHLHLLGRTVVSRTVTVQDSITWTSGVEQLVRGQQIPPQRWSYSHTQSSSGQLLAYSNTSFSTAIGNRTAMTYAAVSAAAADTGSAPLSIRSSALRDDAFTHVLDLFHSELSGDNAHAGDSLLAAEAKDPSGAAKALPSPSPPASSASNAASAITGPGGAGSLLDRLKQMEDSQRQALSFAYSTALSCQSRFPEWDSSSFSHIFHDQPALNALGV